MSFVSLNYDALQLDTVTWLFVQSLSLYIAYLCFQSIFFDRFIACFKIKGNVGFFIVTIDFTGYTGTVLVLMFKEFSNMQCSWLLLGNEYVYDEALACPARPVGRALELCGRFNSVDMNDPNAGIQGGAQKDLSLGLNYYINKHVGVKLNYSYVMPGIHIKEISLKNFSLFQARFQFIL